MNGEDYPERYETGTNITGRRGYDRKQEKALSSKDKARGLSSAVSAGPWCCTLPADPVATIGCDASRRLPFQVGRT